MIDLSKVYEYFQPEKHNEKIHIVGCGSVGSTVAENLARCGLTKFTLWDFDEVEEHNIVNQMFFGDDVGKSKVEALADTLCRINPDIKNDIKLKPDGWDGQQLSGYVFLCVDNIDIRREIVKKHFDNPNVKFMTDFRTRLEDAQMYAADWSNYEEKQNLLNTMNFSQEESMEETPVSACGVTLGVCPTVRVICGFGVANFMNFCNKKEHKKMAVVDIYNFNMIAF